MNSQMLRQLIRESIIHMLESEEAVDTAHRLGLESDGWGYWTKDGKRVAKTIKGPDGKTHLVQLGNKDTQHPVDGPESGTNPDTTHMAPKPPEQDTHPADAQTQEPSVKINPKNVDTEYDPYDPKNKVGLGGDRTQKIDIKSVFPDPVYQERVPGTIKPPKNKKGGPIEVKFPEIDHVNQRITYKIGYIDVYNPRLRAALVTFDDGSYGAYRIEDLIRNNPSLKKQTKERYGNKEIDRIRQNIIALNNMSDEQIAKSYEIPIEDVPNYVDNLFNNFAWEAEKLGHPLTPDDYTLGQMPNYDD